MISDDQRREVARRLRSVTREELRYVFLEEILNFSVGGRCLDDEGDIDDGIILRRLADLIDRPTCRMVECTIDHGSRSWGMRCTACGKEFEHVKPGFGWRFCPNCGAMVTEEGRDVR